MEYRVVEFVIIEWKGQKSANAPQKASGEVAKTEYMCLCEEKQGDDRLTSRALTKYVLELMDKAANKTERDEIRAKWEGGYYTAEIVHRIAVVPPMLPTEKP